MLPDTLLLPEFEKLQFIIKTKRIDQKAVEDFVLFSGLKSDATRKELLEGYQKSRVLFG